MEIQLSEVLKRELHGRKLKEVASETGIPLSLLSDWREGSLPSGKNIGRLHQLAEYFGLGLEELLFNVRTTKTQSTVLQSTQFRDGNRTYRIIIEKI